MLCCLPQGLLRKLIGRCEVMESLPLAPLALPSPGVRPLDLQPLHVCRAPLPDLGDWQYRRQRDEVREGPAGQVCPRVMGRMGGSRRGSRMVKWSDWPPSRPRCFLTSQDPKPGTHSPPGSLICRQNPGAALLLWEHRPSPSVLGTLPAKV